MFESQTKKEPKLVFSHNSQQSTPKASSIQVTKIPRVALVGVSPGQPDQPNSELKRSDVANTSRQTLHARQPEERPTVAQGPGGTPRAHEKDVGDEVEGLKSRHVVSAEFRDTHEGQRNSPLHNTQRYHQVDIRMGNLELKDDADRSKTKLDNNNEELAKNNNEVKSNGQKNNIFYKDTVYAGTTVTNEVKNVTEGKNTLTDSNVHRFEGFSIYRGARENASHELVEAGVTLSKSATVNRSRTPEVNSSETASTMIDSATSPHAPESESVTLRHPGSNARKEADSIPQPYQTVQLPRQQYPTAEHEYQYGTPSAQNRQMDYRYIAVPQGRVKSYPQTPHQVTPKTFRLVGPVMAEPTYAPVKVRAVSGKQRPHSYSVSPRYAVPVTWQVGAAPIGYATLVPDRRVVVVKQRSSSISSRDPYQDHIPYHEPPSPKPPLPASNVRPKSILKNQTQPETAPDWHQNARAMHIPRAQSIKNPSASADQNYDFSHILTANSDTVSYAKNKLDGAHTSDTARPDTPDSTTQQQKNETAQQKKSVKFNSQVRLHTEDHISDVVSLAAPT